MKWLLPVLAVLFSGLLSAAHAQPATPPRGPGEPPGFRMPWGLLDTNHDGELSAEEIAAAPAVLKKLDRNGDGRLSRDELFAAVLGQGGPGTAGGRGMSGGPGPGFGPGRWGGAASNMQTPPRGKDEAEAKILAVLEDLDKNQRRGMMNVPREDGRLLRLLAESLEAKSVVEIGTSNGYSGIWLCLALRKTGGKLITHDIDARRAALARENFAKAGVSSLVTLVEGDAHETVARLKGPVDLVFIDADKEGYLDYLKKILPLVRAGGLVVGHNMNPRMADSGFLKAITTNPDLETVFYMEGGGVSITLKKR